ncbi:MAG: methyltransferase family protein [Bradyrhizobium sp.]
MLLFVEHLRKAYASSKREVVVSLSVGAYFGWSGMTAAAQQIASMRHHPSNEWVLSDYIEMVGDSVGTIFLLCVAMLIVMRHRRISNYPGMYPKLAAIFGSFLFPVLMPYVPKQSLSSAMHLLSLSLVLGGGVLAGFVLLYLGRSFSILPEARRLVQQGPYRLIRHPLYAAEIVALIGIAMQFAIWPTLLVVMFQLFFLLERMRMEEDVLCATFPSYRSYSGRTARLIPGLW